MTTELTFTDCCKYILIAAQDPKQVKQINYAVGYARAGLSMTDPNEQQVQALYVLNNITSWRGDAAKAVRAALKRIGGVK